jgi:uncharacterized protein YecE (DUF72 family)
MQSDNLYLGTQGFAFDDWVGSFYPAGTSSRDYLERYADHFRTVEIDSTWYGTPRPQTVQGWRERTPDGFVFAAKFPQRITHEQKLSGTSLAEAQAFIAVMRGLGDKLGPLVLQFPYDFQPEWLDLLDDFLGELPPDVRYAVEVRHKSWLQTDLRGRLTQRGVAIVQQDLYYMPRIDWVTTNFVYIRWLGRREDVRRFDKVIIDRSQDEAEWAGRVRTYLGQRLTVYGYFNNHWAGHSPASVQGFQALLAQES